MARLVPLALALVASALLVAAEFATLYEIRVITVTVATGTVGDHHGYALGIIGVAAAVMAFVAVLGRSRPAALAMAALGIAALAVVLAVDLPVVDDTGLYGRDYEQASASPGTGFYLETAGAVALLLAGAAMVLFGPRAEREPSRRALSDAA